MLKKDMTIKTGIAGCGALGGIVAGALVEGIDGYELIGISDIRKPPFDVPLMDFEELAEKADLVIECLPPKEVPKLAQIVLKKNKRLVLISAAALLLYPEIETWAAGSEGRIIVPSGALSGLDAVSALNCAGIQSAKIRSTKPPKGFTGAPYVVQEQIDLDAITEKTKLFEGNALEAARAFPANVNVAASLSLAGIGPEKTRVEVWADPDIRGNSHEITVSGERSTITSKVENTPDPANPKSSMLAGYSIVAWLKKQNAKIAGA